MTVYDRLAQIIHPDCYLANVYLIWFTLSGVEFMQTYHMSIPDISAFQDDTLNPTLFFFFHFPLI